MKSDNAPHTISRQHLINKLRALGYSFKGRGKCTELWRKTGGTHRVNLDTRSRLSELYVRTLLRQCDVKPDEIEAFLASARA